MVRLLLCVCRQTSFSNAARKEARMSITGVRAVDEVPAEGTQGDLPPNMSMSTVIHFQSIYAIIIIAW